MLAFGRTLIYVVEIEIEIEILCALCVNHKTPTQSFRHNLVNKNSAGDEIANVNFFYDNIVHVEASAYAH